MQVGVIYAVVAYSVYACGDAIIKGFGQSLSVFEIGFFIAVFSLLPALFVKPKGEHWRQSFQLVHPRLVHLRAFTGVASAALVTYAFVNIPFAETYSLVFMMPLFITIMSVRNHNHLADYCQQGKARQPDCRACALRGGTQRDPDDAKLHHADANPVLAACC